jgi:hypothetical protein
LFFPNTFRQLQAWAGTIFPAVATSGFGTFGFTFPTAVETGFGFLGGCVGRVPLRLRWFGENKERRQQKKVEDSVHRRITDETTGFSQE